MTTALEGGEGSASRPGHSLPPGKTRYPLLQEAGWAPGPVWTGAENLAPTGIRSPYRPIRSHSLYLLSYPAYLRHYNLLTFILFLLLLEALQLQRSFGLLNEFLPFGRVSDAVLPVCYFHPCYIALYIILPSIFRSS